MGSHYYSVRERAGSTRGAYVPSTNNRVRRAMAEHNGMEPNLGGGGQSAVTPDRGEKMMIHDSANRSDSGTGAPGSSSTHSGISDAAETQARDTGARAAVEPLCEEGWAAVATAQPPSDACTRCDDTRTCTAQHWMEWRVRDW